jgi:hypothetical protein
MLPSAKIQNGGCIQDGSVKVFFFHLKILKMIILQNFKNFKIQIEIQSVG